MPSPCEVIEQPLPVELEFPTPRRLPTHMLPALAGCLFAGALLVALGCTPFFKPAAAKAAIEQPTIVQAKTSQNSLVLDGGDSASRSAAKILTGDSVVVQPRPANATSATTAVASSAGASPSTGTPTIAASSSTRGGVTQSATAAHGFAINCDPAHDGMDKNAPRPETAALQGIMSGQSSKAALLDGALYREGDQFGSSVCPWTIAMIDAASVRIEKAFGDRTCGVTIRFSQDKNSASRTRAAQTR